MCYPILDMDAPPAERVYALLCNKSAAEAALLGPLQVITFFASRCNLDAWTLMPELLGWR